MSPSAVASTSARRSHFLAAGILNLGLALLIVSAAAGETGQLGTAALFSLAVHVLVLRVLLVTSPRLLCVANVLAVSWVVWFPLRLIVIQLDRDAVALHPAVKAASDGELAVVWMLGVLGFSAYAIGVMVVRRRRSEGAREPSIPVLSRNTYVTVAALGLVASWALWMAEARSGILAEVTAVFLLGIGGAAFIDARSRRWSWAVPMLVGAAVVFGTATWFKAAAIAPLVAWAVGSVLGGLRMSRLRVFLAVIVALMAFAAVQGQRLTGGSDPIEGARVALFDYDLATGLPKRQANAGAATSNLIRGVLQRTAGGDALLVIRAKTPSVIPFQEGRTLWQPAASVLPGADRLLELELDQLSLGGYFATNFWSVNPASDPSAQAITMPGDLYLNFRVPGVALGMLAIGLVAGLVDRLFPSGAAFGAGVLAYAGLPLATVDSNVAYALVTAAIRLGVVVGLILLTRVGRPGWRSLHGGPARA